MAVDNATVIRFKTSTAPFIQHTLTIRNDTRVSLIRPYLAQHYGFEIRVLSHRGRILKDAQSVEDWRASDGDFVAVIRGAPIKPAISAAVAPAMVTLNRPPWIVLPPAVSVTHTTSAPVVHAVLPERLQTPVEKQMETRPIVATSHGLALDEEQIVHLTSMGFPRATVIHALQTAFGNTERAVQYLTTPESMPQPETIRPSRLEHLSLADTLFSADARPPVARILFGEHNGRWGASRQQQLLRHLPLEQKSTNPASTTRLFPIATSQNAMPCSSATLSTPTSLPVAAAHTTSSSSATLTTSSSAATRTISSTAAAPAYVMPDVKTSDVKMQNLNTSSPSSIHVVSDGNAASGARMDNPTVQTSDPEDSATVAARDLRLLESIGFAPDKALDAYIMAGGVFDDALILLATLEVS